MERNGWKAIPPPKKHDQMMKKRLFSLWLSLSLATVHAQGPVEGPVSTGYYRVTRFDRIETDRDRTVAEVTFRYFPNYWIRFDSLKCFLRDGDGGRTYRLLAAEGFELNREVYMPESGEVSARLIFEPVDADVRSLDFIDPAEAPESNTYGIRPIGAEAAAVPKWAEGNWRASDGSNRWVCGFLPTTVLYDRDFWSYDRIARKGKTLEVRLGKPGDERTLWLREGKGGRMLLSTDGRTFDTLGRDMIGGRGCAEGWRYDPQRYRESMYRPGRVVLRGYLSGYTPKVGFATCMLGMEDVALRKEINHVIEIAPDGRFEIEVPVDHPSTLSLSIGPRMWDYVYVEPGDTLLCCYDLAEAADPRRARSCRDARFMGHAAPYNAYVRLLADRLPDESSADARLSGYVDRGEVPQFCAWMDTLGGRMSDSLSMLLDRYAMDDRTRDMLCTYVDQRLLYCRLDFASRYESKEKLFTRNEDGTYRVEDNPDYRPLPDSFYDFLTTDRLDNPLMIVNENFWAVVNRLEYRPVVSCFRPNGLQRQIAVRAADRVGSRYGSLTDRQSRTLDSLRLGRPFDSTGCDPEVAETFARIRDDMLEYVRRYPKRTNDEVFAGLRKRGLDRCLAVDYVLSRDFATERYDGDSARLAGLERRIAGISTPYVCGKMIRFHIDNSTMPRPDTVAERTPDDEAFDELIAPYAGHVLFIDFWGIGCGPCRTGMLAARKTVEELGDRRIRFLYVSCETDCTKEAHDRFLSENSIRGEHLRVGRDVWNRLSAKLSIGGIPHYAVVDKQGRIVDNNGWCMHGPEACKEKLIELEKR